jgi:subtilisin family serine protease
MDLDYFVLSLKTDSGLRGRSGGIGSLRDRAATPIPEAPDLDGMLGGALEAAVAEAPVTEALALESTTLSEAQAQDAARDPDAMIAPVMPVELIQPLSAADIGADAAADPLAQAMAAKASWGIAGVGADISKMTGQGVTVAVLDTGIDAAHPAFAGVTIVGQDFTNSGGFADKHGHGTHCAGTIFGRDVDGVRIGVARGVTNAVIGKVLDDQGRGSTTAVLKALHWAGAQGANVVSMSLGFDFPAMQEKLQQSGRPQRLATSMALKAYRENLAMFDALLTFLMLENPASQGMVVVAASGNESMRQTDPNFVIDTSLPAASSRDIISVGAVAQAAGGLFDIANFSNTNPVLCAPGVGIVSAKPGGGLVSMNGTSMACPHVAGLAALWWQWLPANAGRASGANVRARLTANTRSGSFTPRTTLADRGSGVAMAPAP